MNDLKFAKFDFDFDQQDAWVWADELVENLAAEARRMAASEPEAQAEIAYAIFRVKAAHAMTRLLERIRDLEDQLVEGME